MTALLALSAICHVVAIAAIWSSRGHVRELREDRDRWRQLWRLADRNCSQLVDLALEQAILTDAKRRDADALGVLTRKGKPS